jgi:hypothetical protein
MVATNLTGKTASIVSGQSLSVSPATSDADRQGTCPIPPASNKLSA